MNTTNSESKQFRLNSHPCPALGTCPVFSLKLSNQLVAAAQAWAGIMASRQAGSDVTSVLQGTKPGVMT